MSFKEILALIDDFEVKLVVLLCHHNADPDALCAAFTFCRLLKRLRPELSTEIAAAQGPSRLAKFVSNSLPVKLTMQPRIEQAGLIALLDTNTIQQLDGWGERVKMSGVPLVVIDHHARHAETEDLATFYVSDEDAASTCEIVYQFFREMKVELTEIEAKALFAGIAFDTRHFILAKSTTFKTVVNLIDAGADVKRDLAMLSLPMEPSERIARLRACRRAKLIKINEWLLAFSFVRSFQASAARALTRLGAHVAVVAGQKENQLQVSLRSSRDFYEKTGVHLGRDIAKPLGEYLQGMGGGHSISAGVNGIGDVKACLQHCAKLLKRRLK